MIETNINNLIARMFQPLTMSKPNVVDIGGRASTKTSKNAICIVLTMLAYPNCECVVIRQDDVHHRNSTMRELETACERLGLVKGVHFRTKVSPKEIELLNTGSKIYFGALNDPEKLKGYKPTNNTKYFGLVWLFELSEFKNELDMEQALATFARGKKEIFHAIYESNPPMQKSHWLHEWIKRIKSNSEYQYTFSTYLDLTDWEKVNWLGINLLRIIDNLKKTNEQLYEYIYLGKDYVTEGMIYRKAFKPSDKEILPLVNLVGVDFGWSNSKTYIVNTVTNYKEFKVMPAIKYDAIDRDTESTIDFIVEYIKGLKGVVYLTPDSAEQGMVRRLKRRLEPYGVKVIDMAKKEIEERILVVIQMMYADMLHVNENSELAITFESAERDSKGIRRDDGSFNNDILDAFEYCLYPLWNNILKLLDLEEVLKVARK